MHDFRVYAYYEQRTILRRYRFKALSCLQVDGYLFWVVPLLSVFGANIVGSSILG